MKLAPLSWMPGMLPELNREIALNAHAAIGVCEDPPGSNRSPVIDRWNREAGMEEGVIRSGRGYWCASAVAAWWREAGAETPGKWKEPGVDEWRNWARKTKRWSQTTPEIGCAVVYGVPHDASHIGVIVRVVPMLLSVEGNTALHGYSRNGVVVTLKLVATTRLLGYIHPSPLE